ncbi:MAG: Na/Pi symporter [Mariprofundaceae bacterium]|nr:Na/Pi symporter [Mariprofundaceae bacterium]
MYKGILTPLLFLIFAWFVVSNDEVRVIIAGIAIFLIGMNYMENGFKLFSGGALEVVLEKFTDNTPKAITTGFLATAVVQSSSLVSVIIISFLSAELIGLTQAVGVIFGSNIGTTTTAWLVSSLGLKINIAHYALPILIFGVVMQFSKMNSYKGLGSVLIGLGFIFLGIDYMKDGFEAIKEGLDLAEYAMDGYLGIFVYILFGIVATVVIQSSSATMAIIITALATGQIDYISALSLAIGANVGTTVTAVLGAMTSNKNGKRLAVAHFVFNMITGFIAVVFIYQLKDLVNVLAPLLSISESNFAMKLALFHTIFNVIGVLAVTPFMRQLVNFLGTLFCSNEKGRGEPKYLNDDVIQIPASAQEAIRKETQHLYDKSIEAILHAMSLHRKDVFSAKEIKDVVHQSKTKIAINVEKVYQNEIKNLYGAIIHYASLAQRQMVEKENNKIYEYKLAARNIIEMVKDIKELQKNINFYMKNKNKIMIDEYNKLRMQLVLSLRIIERIRSYEDLVKGEGAQGEKSTAAYPDEDILTQLEVLKASANADEVTLNQRIDYLIRENKIDSKMASSLMNDGGFSHSIRKKLINLSTIIWIKDLDLKELGDEYEH